MSYHGSAPRGIERTAPLLGQDTDRVLAELLGLSADELAALEASCPSLSDATVRPRPRTTPAA